MIFADLLSLVFSEYKGVGKKTKPRAVIIE